MKAFQRKALDLLLSFKPSKINIREIFNSGSKECFNHFDTRSMGVAGSLMVVAATLQLPFQTHAAGLIFLDAGPHLKLRRI
jgi:hypothetical protein